LFCPLLVPALAPAAAVLEATVDPDAVADAEPALPAPPEPPSWLASEPVLTPVLKATPGEDDAKETPPLLRSPLARASRTVNILWSILVFLSITWSAFWIAWSADVASAACAACACATRTYFFLSSGLSLS
jgi:hypothetical protein